MNKYYEELKKELEEIVRIRKLVITSLENVPEGNIRSEMKQGKYPQYYLVKKDEKQEYPYGRYLKKNEIEIAKQYAQKEYDRKMLSLLDSKEKEIRKLISRKNITGDLKDVFTMMPVAKRKIIEPYILPDDEFIRNWNDDISGEENPYPLTESFVTEKGETVRSKSEKMISDKLYLRGIPYKYEAKLKLKNNLIFYPDFTLLNVRTRQIFYLEHFGMMDNPEYCRKALEKIDIYSENHIYQGEQLFITFESSNKSINMKQIDTIIDRILL